MVSAAAGATGSIAGQIAKIAGARVVGIAGGPQKCRVVVEDFGFDACIDYRENNLAKALKEHCPKGVNVYFDNVGGPILDAVLGRLAHKARVVLCGVISSYLTGEHPGPANYVNLLAKTALMQGFNALDQWGEFDEAFAALRQWEADGRLVHRETVLEGIESCVDALNGLFTGATSARCLSRSVSQRVEVVMSKEHVVALVTGANRGLGRQFAAELVARGAKVYAGARRPETVDLPGVVPVQLDITDAESVRRAGQFPST